MKKIDVEMALLGEQNALDNTWNNKFNKVVPDFQREGSVLKFTANNTVCTIDSFDEIILTILLKYLFMPVWFFKQCYSFNNMVGMFSDKKIEEFVNIGLCWRQDSMAVQYLRPTHALFKLFNREPESFTDIPYNTLTHTVSEAKVMFEVMSGESNLFSKFDFIPRISELGFDPNPNGTNIVTEGDFRNPNLYKQQGIDELSDSENKINMAARTGESFTPELANYRLFPIVKKIGNTGIVKNDYLFHIPDLVIPMLRENGQPRSIAIEVELTSKRISGYEESLNRYKDNNKFGTVIYMCGNPGIAEALKAAYELIGGMGSTKLIVQEFVVPHA